jgi:hypothetical protein
VLLLYLTFCYCATGNPKRNAKKQKNHFFERIYGYLPGIGNITYPARESYIFKQRLLQNSSFATATS